jgi:hypothetical protein
MAKAILAQSADQRAVEGIRWRLPLKTYDPQSHSHGLPKVPQHVNIMTACGYNATTQAGWSSFGKSRDLQSLLDGYAATGLKGMYRIDNPEYSDIACCGNKTSCCTPSARYGRGVICAYGAPNASSHGGIRLCSIAAGDKTDWEQTLSEMVALITPGLLSGSMVGIFLGDEQTGSVPSEHSYRLPFTDFERWVDASRGLLDALTPRIVANGHPPPLLYYMESSRVSQWPHIPRNLTHFSVCQYFPEWMYPNLWVKAVYERFVFPKLGPDTLLLVVPPIMASHTGCPHKPSVFCPNITYAEWLALDEENYTQYTTWAFNDTVSAPSPCHPVSQLLQHA